MKIVIAGLSITSSWGNGHATTYRALLREFAARGHYVTFLERDAPWYADNRDLPRCDYAEVIVYHSLEELRSKHSTTVRNADAVIVGSYVPDGKAVGEWVIDQARGVTAFYDIDTPVTLEKLSRGEADYVSRELIGRYDLYLSFSGGPILRRLQNEFGSSIARPLYCSVDPQAYFPEKATTQWDLGYLGTHSEDRQPALEVLLLEPARRCPSKRFVVAGPQYPKTIHWPVNIRRIEHLPPAEHREFYNRQRFTLNITRGPMVAAGFSPSVRLFEAAACGTPVISDLWTGLETFFAIGAEILVARNAEEVCGYLRELSPDAARKIGDAARRVVLARHTAAHRAAELEAYLEEVRSARAPRLANHAHDRSTDARLWQGDKLPAEESPHPAEVARPDMKEASFA